MDKEEQAAQGKEESASQITPLFWYRLLCAVPVFAFYCWGGTLIFHDLPPFFGWVVIGIVGSLLGAKMSW